MENKKGFTLAEVLITLTILGVVAALTVPSLIHKFQDRIAISSVKKTWSMLENALEQMYIIEGKPSTWDWSAYTTNETRANYFAEKFIKYVNVEKFCGSSSGCFPSKNDSKCSAGNYNIYCNLHGINSQQYIDNQNYGKFRLKNGMSINVSITPSMFNSSTVTSTTNKFRVDINGKKGPNRLGYDVFYFEFNDKGLLLANASYYSHWYCNKTSSGGMDGWTCSTWIMKHGNMDYKYRDISAEW